MANDSVTALVSASMDFVQAELSRGGAATPHDDIFQYMYALMETTAQFFIACPKPMDRAARSKLGKFFKVTVGQRIMTGKMGWIGDPRRDFALMCTIYLGERALYHARSGDVTRDVLDAAACDLIRQKDGDECPIPLNRMENPRTRANPCPGIPEDRGTACADLGGAIGLALDEMSESEENGGGAGGSGR